MPTNTTIREQEIKNKVAKSFFADFDCTKVLGDIDFAVSIEKTAAQLDFPDVHLLWAEAKADPSSPADMLAQLMLTIGKTQTYIREMPPSFLGGIDNEKMVFVPYSKFQYLVHRSDFDWKKITPSNVSADYFKKMRSLIEEVISEPTSNYLEFRYIDTDGEKDLRTFIRKNLIEGKGDPSKISINENNFTHIYYKWMERVRPSIKMDWETAKKMNILDGDFYLADLMSEDNKSFNEKLFVLLMNDRYKWGREVDEHGITTLREVGFNDTQKAHAQFWAIYERPPRKEFQDGIIKRRDLLVPQDVRERKGSFFTPYKWVKLSQEYIKKALGENWQDNYYVWDCAAGTGNLLEGLTNKDNIYASTLDRQDVGVMKERIEGRLLNLWDDNVFQFDFLNDDFTRQSDGGKLPDKLHDIIQDEEKRKKLLIYINPPYAEGDAAVGRGRRGVQISMIHEQYKTDLGKASGELFAQFLMRIYKEIQSCRLANFSKLKNLQAPNFGHFRNIFQARLLTSFIVPAKSFENIKGGSFPIGFFVWDTSIQEKFQHTIADVHGDKQIAKKHIYSYDGHKYISDWLEEQSKNISKDKKDFVGHLASVGNDFQNQNMVFIDDVNKRRKKGGRHTMITAENLIVASIYFAVRHVIPATWINDRDQFLYPNDGWKTDMEFQSDCLVYTLFNNNIQSQYGTNYWIPFTEKELGLTNRFESRFMTDFMQGKKFKPKQGKVLFTEHAEEVSALVLSEESKAVMQAGKELWKYYMAQPNHNINASYYDIRKHFQGTDAKGRMNNSSDNATYTEHISRLRSALTTLAKKITEKVYLYGFLLEKTEENTDAVSITML